MRRTIVEKLRATWSPEQIVGRLYTGIIAFSTIYRWIYAGRIDVPQTVLRQKGKRQNPTETRGRINIGLPISKRPPEVKERRTFGHWELDTVVSGRGKSKACVATFIERKSRFYLVLPIADRTAASMEGAIHAVNGAFPEGTFETANSRTRSPKSTGDRGNA
ncbi:IS30 family transposase, partial [Exiguobacterium sp. s140]